MKAAFHNQAEPKGRFIGDIKFELHEPLIYHSAIIHCESIIGTIVVPSGTVTDFASIPRFFWRVLSPMDAQTRMPAIVHDYIYTEQIWEKKIADLIFREALIAHKAPRWKISACYNAVKWFGGKAWKKHQAENELRHCAGPPSFSEPY